MNKLNEWRFLDVNCKGDAGRHFNGVIPILVILTIAFNILLNVFYILCFDNISYVYLIVYDIWVIISLQLNGSEKSDLICFVYNLLLILPLMIFTKIYSKYCKRKYPNSDNPDDIRKFIRASKIRKVLN